MISNLNGSQMQDRPGSSESHGTPPPDMNADRIDSTANAVSFILVGYAFGSWVIKRLISQKSHGSMILNAVGAIFLDVDEPTNDVSMTGENEYIESLKKTFAPKIRVENSKIRETMKRIDESFQDSLLYLQGNTEKPLECQSLKLWKNTVNAIGFVIITMTFAKE
jgi:hypothetical protein